MAQFLAKARGKENLDSRAARSGGKFMPNLKWEAGETKYIQFITPVEEIVTVLFHNFIVTGYREEDGKPIYNSFISRRDRAIDGQDGYDELIDRFEVTPSQRSIALAVELEPVFKTSGKRKTIEGFEVAERTFENADGDEKTVPAVHLIIQSPGNFFGWLSTFADMKPIESSIFAVKRVGKTTDTRYDWMETDAEPIDLEGILDEVEFDFDAYLENLADEDRMRELIGPLPDDFKVNPYQQKKGKGGGGGKSTRTQAKEEDAAPEAAEEPEEPASRSRRFSKLREEMKRD